VVQRMAGQMRVVLVAVIMVELGQMLVVGLFE
jgi:hypothetical protein